MRNRAGYRAHFRTRCGRGLGQLKPRRDKTAPLMYTVLWIVFGPEPVVLLLVVTLDFAEKRLASRRAPVKPRDPSLSAPWVSRLELL